MVKKEKNRLKIINVSNEECLEKVLGLDCSSSTVGWGLVGIKDNKPILLSYGQIKPLKSDHDILTRLKDVFDRIIELCEIVKPTEAAVEEFLMFMKARSSATTIVTLASFNRVICIAALVSGVGVTLYPVQTIRKLVRVGIKRKEIIKKEEMPDLIREHLSSDFEFILNRNGVRSEETEDQSDGIAVAWARVLEKNK
jgi:Holliday junction resolvasome RuvABC endonuclease subunit